MMWFKSKEKKTVGVDPTNPSDADIVANAYSRVLKEDEKHPTLRPVSDLPYTKEQIATALMTDSISMRDPGFTRAAGAYYVRLAGFVSEEVAAIAAQMDRCPEDPVRDIGDQSLSPDYAALRGRHAEIMKLFNEEVNRLNREWQSFVELKGLTEPEDNITRLLRGERKHQGR